MLNVKNSFDNPWWKGGVIYQIYPRSYCDANGDGTGDLNGITSQLDYIANLGVDAIWISPFFTSPMKDFGYDVSDYRGIDPIFGVLDDFKRLLLTAHSLGLKVIIDQVYSHTSDQHEWFAESRQSRDNPKADWYVWVDPKADGSPPNNWLSMFGGCAWAWDSRRKQYYLHNFLESQPDLNFHNSDVRRAQLDNAKFWLDMGVDGFRLDVVNFFYHSAKLEDNPALDAGSVKTLAVSVDNPYSMQRHLYDISQPDNLDFLKDLRVLMDQYPHTTTVGEVSADKPLQIMAQYTSGDDKLHMAYTFDLLANDCSAGYIRSVIHTLEDSIGDGWPSWAISNHDVARYVTRWGREKNTLAFPKVAVAMLLSMRGSPCIYQGDELGLPEADVPYEGIQDPYGLPFWPLYKGRDGCRTPMVWRNQAFGDFSQTQPWLPIDPKHLPLAVEEQEIQPDSTLHAIRQMIFWRKQQPALIYGDIQVLDDSEEMLCWVRTCQQQKLVAAFNLGEKTLRYKLPFDVVRILDNPSFSGICERDEVILESYQAFFAEIN